MTIGFGGIACFRLSGCFSYPNFFIESQSHCKLHLRGWAFFSLNGYNKEKRRLSPLFNPHVWVNWYIWTANIETAKKIINKKVEHLFKNRTQRALIFNEKD
jgi:hypothetical protein